MTVPDDFVATVRDSAHKITDQKYLFGIVLFLATLITAGALGATAGTRAAAVVFAGGMILALLVLGVVRALPEPGDLTGTKHEVHWSEKETASILDLLPRRSCVLVYAAVVSAVYEVSEFYQIDPRRVRGAIHARRDGQTCMLADFCVGEFSPGEPGVQMRLGKGAAGQALDEGRPVYLDQKDLGLPGKPGRKVHPYLGWVIAAPVSVTLADGTSMNVWTLNIDGVEDSRSGPELQQLSTVLGRHASDIGRSLSDALVRYEGGKH
jgi:hypothetical protein